MAKLYQYAIIQNPKATKDAQGNDTTQPSSVVVAAREIPDTLLDSLDEIEVLVRPF